MLCAVLLGTASPARADTVTLNGEVVYRERIGLPPRSILRIRLLDLAGLERAIVEGEAALASPGKPPLAFSLTFDERSINSSRTYAMSAEITADGELWFNTLHPYPVDPLQPDQKITLTVTFAGRAATTSVPPEPAPPEILDRTWWAEEIGGEPVAERSETSLSISGDRRAGGRGGCNSFFAQAVVDAERLRFSEVAATHIACAAPNVARQEERYFAALAATRFWRLRRGRLVLLDASGRQLVRFAPARE